MESQNADSINKHGGFRAATPHKKMLPIKQVMERSPLAAGTGTVPSVRLRHGDVGLRPENGNSWRSRISMWCSAYPIS